MSAAETPTPELPRRGKRTRHALLAAAHHLLADRSIDSLAVDDIVQSAGVAKGSFYNHFVDKQELASIIRKDIRKEIEAIVTQVNEHVEDPVARTVRGFAVYVGYILASQHRAQVTLRLNTGLTSASNSLNEGIKRDIAAGLRSGRFVVPSVQAGALFVIGTCQIVLMHAVENVDQADIVTIAQQLGTLMLRGLGVPLSESEAATASAIHELVIKPAPGRKITPYS